MKIICIENNYRAINIKQDIEEPLFFLKPESSLIRNRQPFFLPDFTKKVLPKINIVVKISRLGKHIHEKFAYKYYDEIGIGIDLEANDILNNCKANGLPWEPAKAYDSSAMFSSFVLKSSFENTSDISFSLYKNGNCICKANTSELLFSFDKIISHVSKYVMIKMGDYIFTGSPDITESIDIKDKIECNINDKKMLTLNVK